MTSATLRSTLFAVAVLVPSTASAGGFLTTRFAGEQGHVVSDHASAVYYNPAGLAMRTGTRLVLEGSLGYRTASYERPVEAIDNPGTGTPDDGIAANSGKANLADPVAVPFFAAASDLGLENMGFGVSFSVPFGGVAQWDQNDAFADSEQYPGAVDGVQRWSTIEGTIRSMYISGAVARYIPQAKLSLGLGLNFVMSEVDVLRARQASSTDDLVSSTGEISEGRSLIDVKGNSFSLALGAMWAPSPKLRVGVSWQSQQWTPDEGYGEQRLEGDLTNKFGVGRTETEAIEFTQNLPDVIRVGASYHVDDKLTLRGQFEYQRWSVFDKQCVIQASQPDNTKGCNVKADGSAEMDSTATLARLERAWDDSFGIRVGADYLVNPSIQIIGGVTYDTAAVTDDTLDTSFIDMGKVVIVGGGRFALGQGFSLVAQLTEVVYFERETDVAAGHDGLLPPLRAPSSAGKYNQNVFLGTLSAEYEF